MNRTFKFHLSNVKKSLLYAALITYGITTFFLIVSFSFDGGVESSQPLWLEVLRFIVAPFTLVTILFAMYDGFMFFDSSLRFGLSRKTYFINMILTYVIFSFLLSFATGISEVNWFDMNTLTASNYFSIVAERYLSVGYLLSDFIGTLLIAILALAIYRFKLKSFVIGIFLFSFVMMAISFSGTLVMGDSEFVNTIIQVGKFIVEYQNSIRGFIAVGMIGIYYLFVTRFEVQD